MKKYSLIAFMIGYLLGGLNAYIWLKTHINPLVPTQIPLQVNIEGYTLWKLCSDGKTAAEEISNDGATIIKLPCDRNEIKL